MYLWSLILFSYNHLLHNDVLVKEQLHVHQSSIWHCNLMVMSLSYFVEVHSEVCALGRNSSIVHSSASFSALNACLGWSKVKWESSLVSSVDDRSPINWAFPVPSQKLCCQEADGRSLQPCLLNKQVAGRSRHSALWLRYPSPHAEPRDSS